MTEVRNLQPVEDLGQKITREFYEEQEEYPRLPPAAYHGVLGEYVELMKPTTEAPPEFHYGALVTVLAALFSDRYVQYGTKPLYPNLFSVLAGSTGTSHKNTVVDAALDLVWHVTEEGETLRVLRGLGSREGLLDALPNKGEPVLWRVGEYTGLVKKGAAHSATSTLVELQLELYDRPPTIDNHTRQNKITVDRPNVTMLGDSTEEFLTKTFSDDVLSNGILNRLSLWLGKRSGPIAFPDNVETADRNRLVKDIGEAVRASSHAGGGEVRASTDAEKYWEGLYAEEVYPRQEGPDGNVLGRLQVFPWKFALLYAVLDGRQEISQKDLERGWAVSGYLADCALRVAGKIGTSEKVEIMETLVRKVRAGGTLPSPGAIWSRLSDRQTRQLRQYGGAQKLLKQLAIDEEIHAEDPEKGPYWA